MAPPAREVRVSGAVVGRLLYEAGRAGDQEGLLFGRRTTLTSAQKGDHNEAPKVTAVDTTEVVAYLPLGSGMTFYSPAGVVHPSVAAFALPSGLDTVGWFRLRRHSAPRPSVREAAVHHDLGAHLKAPVFGLVTEQRAGDRATVQQPVAFFWEDPQARAITTLPCHIINLGSSSLPVYQQFQTWAPTGVTIESWGTDPTFDAQALAAARQQVATSESYFNYVVKELEEDAADAHAAAQLVRVQEAVVKVLRARLLVAPAAGHPAERTLNYPSAEAPRPPEGDVAPPDGSERSIPDPEGSELLP